MKYLKTFEEKNIGQLYHFTGLMHLSNILQTNELYSSRIVDMMASLRNQRGLKDKQQWHFISFTRNKNFYKTNYMNIDTPITCRITIDGNKLSQYYKLYSVNDWFDNQSNNTLSLESEEAIVVNHSLNNLDKFILKIEIPSYETFMEKEFDSDNDYSMHLEEFASDMNFNYEELYDYLIKDIDYDSYLK